MSFDLNSLSGLSDAQEAGYEVEILHPKTGEPVGIMVKVSGPDSVKQKAGRSAVVEDRIAKKVRKVTPARAEHEANTLVAHSIISWSGVVNAGNAIDYSVANAIKLFEQHTWLREQIQAAADDRANFIKT